MICHKINLLLTIDFLQSKSRVLRNHDLLRRGILLDIPCEIIVGELLVGADVRKSVKERNKCFCSNLFKRNHSMLGFSLRILVHDMLVVTVSFVFSDLDIFNRHDLQISDLCFFGAFGAPSHVEVIVREFTDCRLLFLFEPCVQHNLILVFGEYIGDSLGQCSRHVLCLIRLPLCILNDRSDSAHNIIKSLLAARNLHLTHHICCDTVYLTYVGRRLILPQHLLGY